MIKRIFSTVLMIGLSIGLISCGQKDEQTSSDSLNVAFNEDIDINDNEAAEPVAAGEIVLCFSGTGNTKAIGETIAEIKGIDLVEIVPKKAYTEDDLNWHDDNSRTSIEQNNKDARPEIGSELPDLSDITTIYLGFPIWWVEEPRIIDTLLETIDLTDRNVVLFCTSGSSGIEKAESNIKEKIGEEKVLSAKRFSAGVTKEEIEEWLFSIDIDSRARSSVNTAKSITISAEGIDLPAYLADAKAGEELYDMLDDGPITISVEDYGGFEKVGDFPGTLTKDDRKVSTNPGNVMLYQGDKIVFFYGQNEWDYTPLCYVYGESVQSIEAAFKDATEITLTR